MARITVEDCVKVVPNRFELCLIASNRAKAILSGANTTLNRKEKPSVIALREIAHEMVDVNIIRDNIINTIKNRNFVEINQSTDENVADVMNEESEPNLVLKDDTFVSENIDVND
jgi:DNA-directed RNA polymerase subunit omega